MEQAPGVSVPQPQKKFPTFLVGVILLVIIIALIGGVIFVLSKGAAKPLSQPTASTSQTDYNNPFQETDVASSQTTNPFTEASQESSDTYQNPFADE